MLPHQCELFRSHLTLGTNKYHQNHLKYETHDRTERSATDYSSMNCGFAVPTQQVESIYMRRSSPDYEDVSPFSGGCS